MLTAPPAAYWIAFGPHGPRALDPPGEGKSLFFHVILVLAATGGLFAVIRMFAGQAPESMTKEWQEQSNELLKVCVAVNPRVALAFKLQSSNSYLPLGTTGRPHYRYLLGILQGLGHGPVSSEECLISTLDTSYPPWPLVISLSHPSLFSFVHRAKRIFGRISFGKALRTSLATV